MRDLVQAIGAKFGERYEIIGPIGEGGFAKVYRAKQLATGQSVAVKVLRLPEGSTEAANEKRVARFQREMQICAQIHHPNIVRLIDSGQGEGGVVYSIFEFLPGKNLGELLAEEGRLDPSEARHFMMQLLDALACAHAAGIVHRDLKPANVMIVSTGARRNALVLDFGIGALTQESRQEELDERQGQATSPARLTATHESIGTPCYAAPEQLRGQPPTPRSDLYAWGLCFLECLSGKRVIDGATLAEVVFKQLSPDPIPIPDGIADHPLGRLLRRVTAKDPSLREDTADKLLHELERCDVSGLRPRTAPVLVHPASADATTATMSFSPTPGSGGGGALRRLIEGERRQITALACQLTAGRAGANPADTEEIDHVLGVHQEACAEIACRFEAHVAGAVGDALLFYFGYPTAREDDAGRAARAALAMVAEIRRRAAALAEERGIQVDLRAGLHTGLVVARELGDPGRLGFVVGGTPKLAARLAAVIEPGGVAVSDSTQRLLRKRFALEEAGLRVADDASVPVQVYALREGDASGGERDLPLVGREREMAAITDRWEKARGGAGQALLLTGEAGIGKSRLVRELHERIGTEPHTWIESRAAPDGVSSAFYPIIDLLDRVLDPRREAGAGGKLTRLEALLSLYGFELSEAMPLFAPLLSLSLPSRWAPLDVSARRRRELTRDAVLSLIFEMAEKQPVVLLIEDLHWADPSTLELLGQLVGEVASARVLALFTARPELSPPWPATSFVPVQLGRFGRPEVEQMATSVTGGRTLPEEVLATVADRTDGVPLFVEELLLSMIESGALVEKGEAYALAGPLSAVTVPATLRDSLVARLDRLGRAKETAQVASAIGRELTFELLRAVSPLSPAATQEDLDKLVAAELLFRKRRIKNPSYLFKHALVRDAAYDSMLKRSRVEVHGRIARALGEHFPEMVEERPELMAHHLAAAEQRREAVGYAQKAAAAALKRSAYQEALAHARDAIAWLPAFEDERDRARRELSLLGVVMPALMSSQGWRGPELKAAVDRSHAIVDLLGEGPEVLPALWTLCVYHHLGGGRRADVRALGERILRVSRAAGDVLGEAFALPLLGAAAMLDGDLATARAHFEQALSLYDAERDREARFVYGEDAKVDIHNGLSRILWAMGYADQSQRHTQESRAWARELNHANSTGLSLLYATNLACERGDKAAAAALSAEHAELARKHGLSEQMVYVGILRAWATSDLEAAERLLAQLDAVGTEMGLSVYRSLAALIEVDRGLHDAALARLGHARTRAEVAAEPLFVPRLLRLEGQIALARDPGAREAARGAFERAREMARGFGAKMEELSASTALARLLAGEGRRDEARATLTPVFAWFTEGFGAPPLIEARALLDELR